MIEAQWRIELFAGPRAIHDDRIVTRFRTRKTGLLLAYLASHLPRHQSREVLIELLWPGCETSAGRNNLSKELTALRHLLEPPGVPAGAILLTDRQAVQLNPVAVTCDVALFDTALQAAARARTEPDRRQRLADAVELYAGEFLPGCFEEWVLQERLRLSEGFFEALRQLIAALEQAGDLQGALRVARLAARADPFREEAARDLMRLLAACDAPEAALRHHAQLERLLEQELAAAPEEETCALAQTLTHQLSLIADVSGKEELVDRAEEIAAPARRSSSQPSSVPTGTMTLLLAEITETEAQARPREPGFAAGAGNCWDLLSPVLRGHGGHPSAAAGETLLFLFGRASDALAAALAGMAAFRGACYPMPMLRMALHAGEVEPGEPVPQSPVLAHTTGLLTAAHPGQILLSEPVAAPLPHDRAGAPPLRELGRYRLGPGVEPERLFQADELGAARRRFPPPRALPASLGNLPPAFTRFFGREGEIAHLCALLVPVESSVTHESSTRLVTLTGPGGSGKTRLALEIAARLHESFRYAVWFVPLADVTEASHIMDKVLATLRAPRSPEAEPLDQAAAVLDRQPALLLLDNFEHLAGEGAVVVQALLECAPALTCLVTSRRRLNLAAEQEFPVAPLPVPAERGKLRVESPAKADPSHRSDPTDLSILAACPSVRIFVDRAQAARPDFQLTPRNAAAVAELCRQLEGIPLAIVMAAARAPILTPKQMLAQLAHRFDLLVSRRQGAHERHRSLRAALGWSFELLSPSLRQFFARLSVFRGGWDLEAAQALLANTEPAAPALECLAELRESSLVIAEEYGETMRWRMLETLREFAGERLTGDEHAALREWHGQYYLALAERAWDAFVGPERGPWLNRLEVEHDNLRGALAWSLDAAESEGWLVASPAEAGARADLPLPELTTSHPPLTTALRLAGALQGFWVARGHWSEGRRWLEAVLAWTPDAGATAARARALCGAGWLAEVQHDYQTARPLLEESAAIFRELGDKRGLARSLRWLGYVLFHLGEMAAAEACQRESVTLSREIGDRWELTGSLNSLAEVIRFAGDEGRALIEESLATARQLGHSWVVAANLDVLGVQAWERGDSEAARRLMEESLAQWRQIGHQEGTARELHQLGALALDRADWAAARSLLAPSLAIHRDLGLKVKTGLGLVGMARLAAACRQPERAARLLAAAERLCAAAGRQPDWLFFDRPRREQLTATVRASLGGQAFAAAAAEGKAMSQEQEVRFALEETAIPACR